MSACVLRSRWVIAIASILIAYQAEAQRKWKFDAYPDYIEVLERVYATYEVGCDGCEVKLAKDPNGWWVHHILNGEVQDRYHIWSYQKRKYVEPELSKLKPGDAPVEKEKRADTPWIAGYYRSCPYYGYRGWHVDVLAEYGGVNELPPLAIYGLARAYSSAASCLVGDRSEDCRARASFIDTTLSDRLSEQEINTYIQLAQKSVDAFDRLARIAPDFDTHVGEVSLKAAHQPVTMYEELLCAGVEETKARRVLKPDLYEPFYTAMARNYLASCEQNAILFTNGDTDTYPLWYVQAMEGFRTDVLVVNLSLLNLPRYISLVRIGQLGVQGPAMSISEKDYAREELCVAMQTGGVVDDTISADALLGMIARPKTNRSYQYALYANSNSYVVGPDGDTLFWKLPKHILRNGIAVIDIVAHAADRPIQWANTVGPENYFGLDEHLAQQGLANKLVASSTGTRIQATGTIDRADAQRSADLFLNAFDWSGLAGTGSNKARMVANYRLQMSSTAEALLASGDTARARQLLDASVHYMPDGIWRFDRILLPTIEAYYAIGDLGRADSLTMILARNQKELRVTYSWLEKPASNEERIRELVMERLRMNAETHGRTEVVTYIDALPKGWPEPAIERFW